jgi:hypothetical protein
MYLACYSRLALGLALPTLALYLTPRTAPEETENIVTRVRQRLAGSSGEVESATSELKSRQ